MKEQELEQLSNNKERLGQRFGIHTWGPQKVEETGSKTRFDKTPPQRLGANSPLRKKSNSKSPRKMSSGRRKSLGASGSPLRQKSISPQRPYMPQAISSSQNDYLVQLQNDNSSLQRRLNLVLQELDRVNRDRSNLAQKFKLAEQDVGRMRRMLQEEDLDDKVNRDLQMELNSIKDQNKDSKLRIADIDRRRSDVMAQLRVLQGERDRFMMNNDEMSKDFQRKMGMAKALESELFHGHDRIQKIMEQIESLQRQNASDNAHQYDIQLGLDRLRVERDDLMRKMQQLNRTYDNCVSEITRERAQMQLHNKHHSKLLVAKGMFQLLEVMQLARKQDAVNEFFTYCRFDQKCHSTLKTFVDVLERLGQFKLKIAIKQWHQKTFNPIETIDQCNQLVNVLKDRKLLYRMWNRWRRRFLLTQNNYGHKTKALQAIWDAKCKDVKKEVQRAFTIWREKNNFAKLRERKFKFMLWRNYSNKLSNAFTRWLRNCHELDSQMRLHILARTFAENQLKQITLHQLKIRTTEAKRRRLDILRSYYKAWHESNAYRKYMIDQNVSVMHFRKQCNRSLLKMTFDALRHEKEVEKHHLMLSALEDETLPAIDELNRTIEEKTNNEDRTLKTRALNTMQNMLRTWIGSYFHKWHNMKDAKQFGVSVHLKQIIIRAHKTRLSTAFATWKKGKQFKEITMQQIELTEQGDEAVQLQHQSDELGNEIQKTQQEHDRAAQTSLHRAINIANKRFMLRGLRTWHENVSHRISKEVTVDDQLIGKMRLRILRQAFNHYRQQANRLTQMAKNEERSQQMVKFKYNLRTKRMIYNAWTAYKNTFQKSTANLGVLAKKMDLWLQRRAFKKWINQQARKVEQILIYQTGEQSGQLEELMKASKEQELIHHTKTEENRTMNKQLKTQAGHRMAEYYARCYYQRCRHGFEKWRIWLDQLKYKEHMAQNIYTRWRRYNAFFLFNTLREWMEKQRILQQEGRSQNLSTDIEKVNLASRCDDKTFDQQQAELQAQIDAQNDLANYASQKFQTQVGILMLKVDENHYMSKLRACFLSWRDHTRRTVAFCKTLTHVISQTLWHQGFQNIKEFSRDKHLTRCQNVSLNKLRKMFWRRNCGAAFSRWKEKEFLVACQAIEFAHSEIERNEENYTNKITTIKDHNCDKYERYKYYVDKHKVFQEWRAVTTMLKAHRNAKKTTLESFGGYLQVRALRKWMQRVKATQFARDRVQKYQAFRNQLYKNAVFRELKAKYRREKALVLALANMAMKYDNTAKQSAFQMIQNFKLAKDQVYSQRKKVAAQDAFSIMHKLYISRMNRYMSELRVKLYSNKESTTKRITAINHMMSRGLRWAFEKWKRKAECDQTVQDVNECGPVVEEVLEARLQIKNCMDFLKKEGYTQKQIDEFEELADKRNLDKLRKAVGHWRAHVNREPDDTQLLPVCMERWKLYTKMRKIINHWLNFITVKQEPLKAELKRYFDRWKFHFNSKDAYLNRQGRQYLLNRCIKSQRELNKLTEEEVQNEDLVSHLSQQNDELYDNYIKSTRLAFALSRDNLEHAKRKAFGNLMVNKNSKAIQRFSDFLGANIDMISGLKNKIAEIEKDNELLANENEELRQFTLDGYQIAKNVQNLDQEREKLSIDLADKAATIKKLLDENERLSAKLRTVQEQVVRTADEMQTFSQRKLVVDNNSTGRKAYRQF